MHTRTRTHMSWSRVLLDSQHRIRELFKFSWMKKNREKITAVQKYELVKTTETIKFGKVGKVIISQTQIRNLHLQSFDSIQTELFE